MLSIFTLKQVAPSLNIVGETVTMSKADFSKFAQLMAEQIVVDENWYLSQHADVANAVKRGDIPSGTSHFRTSGFMEGRLPSAPKVDEAWYLKTYPDVARAVKSGTVKSAYDHYSADGLIEGRLPQPPSRR